MVDEERIQLLFEAAVLGVLVIVATVFTGWARYHALGNNLIDYPNHRSSHSAPTPRGGGLAIVISFLLALGPLTFSGQLDADTFLALGGGGVLVAAIGYWDDRYDLSAIIRLLGHFAAAIWAIAWVGEIPSLDLGLATLHWGRADYIVSALGIVWLLNLYNFMDGIDGIAASEAVFVAGFGGILLLNAGAKGLGYTSLSLAAASIGFLFWNWPPAKIFMGDVGSGFLGYVLAVLAIASSHKTDVSLWVWLLLLSVFIVDATITLLRRLLRGNRVYQAHRSHAYQHAATVYDSHLKVTVAIIAINVFWLLPLTVATWYWPKLTLLFTAIALLLLLGLAVWFQAGAEEHSLPAVTSQTVTGKEIPER